MRTLRAAAVAAGMAMAAAGCGGGGGGTPTSPTGGGSTLPTSVTITITSSGVSSREVTVAQGGRVTFVNNDTRPHDMTSDPHPEHTQCPEINQVGFLQPGQQRTTGNLNTVRTCGFHDHGMPDVASLRGTIRIQ